VWSITQERRMVTLHACVDKGLSGDRMVKAIKERLHSKFGLDHATIEIEHGVCADAKAEAHSA
jgi:cobalt-zinc-cadmium efflux system protein